MDSHRAETFLDAWADRMRPATAPYDRSNKVRADWAELLKKYSASTCNDAWREWQNAGHTKWPNYYQMTRLLDAHSNTLRDIECDWCSGSGWIPADSFHNRGIEYSAAKPCTCEHGQRAAGSKIWKETTQLQSNHAGL